MKTVVISLKLKLFYKGFTKMNMYIILILFSSFFMKNFVLFNPHALRKERTKSYEALDGS